MKDKLDKGKTLIMKTDYHTVCAILKELEIVEMEFEFDTVISITSKDAPTVKLELTPALNNLFKYLKHWKEENTAKPLK